MIIQFPMKPHSGTMPASGGAAVLCRVSSEKETLDGIETPILLRNQTLPLVEFTQNPLIGREGTPQHLTATSRDAIKEVGCWLVLGAAALILAWLGVL